MVITDTINKGSIEYREIDVTDKLNAITDLSTYTVEQKIVTEDEKTTKQNWTAVDQVTGMSILCLIDTTSFDDGGNYKLYVRVHVDPEVPILGPFEFGVS